MGTRDFIDEIIQIRERRSSNSSHIESFQRLSSLEQAFKAAPKDQHEIIKYFPIALVATMEGCFRVMAAELIDHGQPFFDNCVQLLKNHKITFELIKAFQGQQVSVGEFVSHIVSINSLSDIDALLSTILDTEFLKELKDHRSRWDIEILKKEDIPILSNADTIYKNVSRTFELRHIFCHETATKIDFDYEEIEECFLSVSIFLKASVDYVTEKMHPNAPLTQTDMNIHSAETLDKVIKEIIQLKNQIIQKLSEQSDRISELESSHEKWLEYMNAFSTFSADAYKGGSIWPLIYNTTASKLANRYLDTLKKELISIDEH
ncbi:hypothetical protein PL263_09750 [Methylomonas sp. EFPC3]|uniref:lysozyme inhibitor LprI family protein n=1 Tax=Methylomonas sp. EFPC3 TaxID=3021710 RepID=UPI0024175E89|nr:lysozyme inhibitor LprI family protein [Methylomonas sp. EFPC3]WFP52291.1 hypothetical protein PL263_09750 [Methylomonas sp. EFPC3]